MSKKPCYFCNSTGHHQSICNSIDGDKDQNWRKDSPQRGNVSKDGGRPQGDEKKLAANALHAKDYANKGMLMTALTNATNAITGKSLKCRVIFDTAWDTTFIKESFAQDLGLKMESLPTTEVGGFGNQKTKLQAKAVKFNLGGINVRAKKTKLICRPLTRKRFSKK